MADIPSSLLNNRRRRAMIACSNCRRRKIKCVTTEEPPRKPCQRCTKRGLVCEYVAVEDDEPDTTPESPPPPLPSHTSLPPQHFPPGAHMRGHGPQYPPSQPTPYGQWANQSQPIPVPYNGYPTPQPPYMQPQGYPSPYGYPQQFNPQNQWAQGSHRCAGCRANPCLCYGRS